MPQWEILNLSNSSTGLEGILAAEAAQINGLAAGLLFLVYMVLLGAGYFAQERRTGAGNLLMWASISGLITTTGAFILYLYDVTNPSVALINIEIVLICVVVTIISAFAFLLSERY